MIEWLIYPVSGVMKLWFLAIRALGAPTSVAWVVSLCGLIMTVRSIIAPFSYIQYRAGRIMVNLRPTLRRLEDSGRFIDTGEELQAHQDAKKQAMKQAGHNPAAGCVPALIQIPVFIGLYQVLLRMARPTEGINGVHHAIGFLTPDDVTSFLAVRVDGIPLPAHVRMTAQQYAELGVTQEQVFDFVAPFFIAAAIFSTLNMLYSLYRSWLTMDFRSRNSRGLYKTFIVMAIITPLFPLSFGLTGPGPAALAFYWFLNTLWTAVQMVVLNMILDRKMPISEEFREIRNQEHADYKAYRRLKRRARLHRDAREELRAQRAEKTADAQRAKDARAKARKELKALQATKDTPDTADNTGSNGTADSTDTTDATNTAPTDRDGDTAGTRNTVDAAGTADSDVADAGLADTPPMGAADATPGAHTRARRGGRHRKDD
ncbi:membrane protein insertase YidC [Corynebacterium sp. 13CS0277]|uniref:membrane protein insertase YidC n=1 Tax=Corynebacterium sp. 13CS0277 TaxID=2071994 RepID=UPI000D0251F5|nr:membrane protein insertase YidC [Corynebacterium sp. 13CS0277]PRQ10464.1 membrane protein insertase YidC [Corynebacterium sp. 13CS0277]